MSQAEISPTIVLKARRPVVAGERHNRLVAVMVAPRIKRHTRWLYKCDCGKETITDSSAVRSGKIRSCGCLKRENTAKAARARATHGHARKGKISTEYVAWATMRNRCQKPTDKSYRNYGGRGISVADRWQLFQNFYDDVGPKPSPKHSLDRIDVNGNYEPSNCRWATASQQRVNQRPRIEVLSTEALVAELRRRGVVV